MTVTTSNVGQELPAFIGPPVPAKSGGAFRSTIQHVQPPANAEKGNPGGTRQAKGGDDAPSEPRPVPEKEKPSPPESVSAAMLATTGTWDAARALVPQPLATLDEGGDGWTLAAGGANVFGLPLSGTDLPASATGGRQFGEVLTNRVSVAGMQAKGADAANDKEGAAASPGATGTNDAKGAGRVAKSDSSAHTLHPTKTVAQPTAAGDCSAPENLQLASRQGVQAPGPSFHNDPAQTTSEGRAEVDDSTSIQPENRTGEPVLSQGTPSVGGDSQQTKDVVASSAPTIETAPQPVSSQPLPVAAFEIKGDDKTRPTTSGVTAIEGKAPGKKSAGAATPDRSDARSEKSPARTEPDSQLANDGAANRAGTMLNRMAEADGRFNPAQTAPAPDASGLPGNESQHGTTSERPAQSNHPDSLAAPGHDRTGMQLPDGVQLGTTINSTRLVERLKQSEINLNVRTLDFGNVSIHTAVNHERLSAQISLERNDLGKAIAGEAPSLESKLRQEHGIQATIEVRQQGESYSGNSGQSQQHTARPQAAFHTVFEPDAPQTTINLPTAVADGRLDIRV